MREFHPQKRGLQWVEAAIEALHFVHIFFARAIIAQHADAVGDFWVVGRDRAAIAHGAEILARIKAPGHGIAMRAEALAFVSRTMGLGGIFEYVKPVFAGDLNDRIQIRGLAIEMHRQKDTRPRGDRRLDAGRGQYCRSERLAPPELA